MIAIIAGILALVISVLLILIVLVQNSKGGGLSSAFGASNISSMIGNRRATQDVEKFTWYLAGALMLVSFLTNMVGSTKATGESGTRMSNQIENVNFGQTSVPSAPVEEAPLGGDEE